MNKKAMHDLSCCSRDDVEGKAEEAQERDRNDEEEVKSEKREEEEKGSGQTVNGVVVEKRQDSGGSWRIGGTEKGAEGLSSSKK